MTRKDCLMAAIDAVCNDRQHTYGKPEDNFKLIADLWSTYTGAKIGPQDVAVMMILLKTARAKNSNHDDNFVDIAGYAACAAEIVRITTGKNITVGKEQKKRENQQTIFTSIVH